MSPANAQIKRLPGGRPTLSHARCSREDFVSILYGRRSSITERGERVKTPAQRCPGNILTA